MSEMEVKKLLYDADLMVNEFIAGWIDGWREKKDIEEGIVNETSRSNKT